MRVVTPHLRLSIALVALLLSTVLVADFINLLPRPDEQARLARTMVGESLAIQLSGAASNGGTELIQPTLEAIVRRNPEIVYAALLREDGRRVVSFGDGGTAEDDSWDASSGRSLVVPIHEGDIRWGEVRLQFAPTEDWGSLYLGTSTRTLTFMGFLAAACLLMFYLFMRKALSELDPSKAIPRRVMAAFDVLAEGVLIVDERERIVLANRSFAQKMGEEPENMVGKNPKQYGWDLKGDDAQELPWQTVLKSGEHVVGMPLRIRVDADEIAYTVNAAPIEDARSVRRGVLVTFDDMTPIEAKNAELARTLAELNVTQRIIEQKNEQLEELATRDSLTGCLNRRAFLEAYEKVYGRAKRDETALSVLMVDIDNFKGVNDRHGHLVGDEAIKLVVDVLHTSFRGRASVGRYGGEEFAVALPGASLAESLKAADGLRKTLSARVKRSTLPVESLTVSVGVASIAEELADSVTLIDRADRALYKAKETGRDRVCAYEPDDAARPGPRAEPAKSDGATHTLDVKQLRARLRDMKQVIHQQAQDITHKAMHDELTGLPNRFLFMDRLSQAIRASDRNDSITAVLCLSLSRYRETCDLIGYSAAEELIKQAAKRLSTVVRVGDRVDVVGDKRPVTFSRLGDNELAVLVVDVQTVEAVASIVARVTSVLEDEFQVGDSEITNHVHCGVALHPLDSRDPALLVRDASLARRHAERRSPHYSDSAYFSSDIDALAAKNAGITAELRKAIRENGLTVVYQPKVDAITNKITGAEALARWNHPEIGAVSPREFVAVAENIGLIHDLTNYVLSRVCEDLSTDALDDMAVSVNVSPVELYDPDTADRILRIVRDRNISTGRLEVEITESSLLKNFTQARETLVKLRDAGVLVVLDDFGTAYSSLNLLVEMPVDVVKIDRCFVTNVHQTPSNRAVTRAIVQMARAMSKRVVAEGVETVDERDCLLALGCREIQGFLYSKPVSFEELRSLVAQVGVADGSKLDAATALDPEHWEIEPLSAATRS